MKLRWYQEECVESVFDYFDKHGGTDKNGFPVEANPVIALPTGTGKSVVIAELFKRALQRYPQTRGLMSTHIKELISQNAEKMIGLWPLAPLGIYSAGLNQRDAVQPIIFGGIRSMIGKWPMFGKRDLLVIDEGHLLSNDNDTSYVKFINELRYGPDFDPEKGLTREIFERAMRSPSCNPYLKVIMLTATPYRLGLGHLTNGNIATHVAYDLCNIDGFNRLMAEGFLCPVVPRKTDTEFDLSNVGIQSGDFNKKALEQAVDKEELTFKCLKQLVEAGYNRRCGLIFASGVSHAVHINEMMNSVFGQECVVIHSSNEEHKRSSSENDEALKAWKAGRVKWAVNMNKLTVGVDNPALDIIGMLRATISTGLWVQMLGRGTRPFYAPGFNLEDFSSRWASIVAGGKQNCLVLDFAGNTRRLGPINDPIIPRMKGEGPPGDAPVWICECGVYNHASARECIVCGEKHVFKSKLSGKAGTDDLLRSDLPQVEVFDVSRAIYVAHTTKSNDRSMIKIAYYCNNLRTFYQYVTVEGKKGSDKLDFAAKKGRDWFRQVYPGEPPATNAEVLQLVSYLRAPVKIRVWVNKQFPEVLSYEF